MNRICVATSDGRAYYAIASRLREAGLGFFSPPAGSEGRLCDLVVTTRAEAGSFGTPTVILEDLDDDPDVARGQILSRLVRGGEVLLVGIDPGSRIGMAAFLGGTRLASRTFNSKSFACATVVKLVQNVAPHESLIRIGDGDARMAGWIAESLAAQLPRTVVEIVNESGTSKRVRVKGLQKDEGAAAMIAFRRGAQFTRGARPAKSR